jgi:predicted HNH restriction endonuclease
LGSRGDDDARYAEESDIEGTKTEALRLTTKRSRKLRDLAFKAANNICSVCDRDYSIVLGGRGVRVLQVHHREQLSARETPAITKLSDLVVVCANCHLLIHLDPKKALTVQRLRNMLRANGS